MSTATATSPSRNLISPQEAANRLNVSVDTLADWRCRKTVNLPFVKCGRSVKYEVRDVEAFMDANKQLAPASVG